MIETSGTGTRLAAATLPAIRSIVSGVAKPGQSKRVIGIHARPEWAGEPSFPLEGASGETLVQVRACPSALAVREELIAHRGNPGYLVVLTDTDAADLGLGLLTHLVRGMLIPLKPWDLLKQSFAARSVDPLLLAEDWAASALGRWEPAGSGWPPAPGGALTREHALGHLASVLFGARADGEPYLTPGHPDATGLLRWSLDPVATAAVAALPGEVRIGLTNWLGGVTGPAGIWTLRAAAAGHGGDALPLALAAGLLWPEGRTGVQSIGEARGLLRARLGGADLPAEQAQTWSRAAEAAIVQLNQPDGLLERAEELLRKFNAGALITRSTLLPGAYDSRLREFAKTVRNALPVPGPAELDRAEQAYAQLAAHELAQRGMDRERRAVVAQMALRLLRSLAVPDEPALTLADTLHHQIRVGAYAEWAFADVWDGDLDEQVGRAYRSLLEVVAARRDARDRVLAGHLATMVAADSPPGTLVPIESALSTLVRPLGRSLLIVLDGMSAGVLAELAAELVGSRWIELIDSALGHRRVLLPALPTVTETCRTSLLTGTLRTGGQREEKSGFAAATGDPAARLFHKYELRAPGGHSLHSEVRGAVEGEARVVGVVLNTVDDALDKMDPGGTTWTRAQVRHLTALTEAARATGRTLILTSDHGHVIERDSVPLTGTGAESARWRPVGGPVTEGEIAIEGRRVLLGGGAAVLPWREGLRYTAKRAGYHGGVSAAEVAVPFAVFSAAPVDGIAGWRPAPAQEPAWWHSTVTLAASTAAPVTPPAPRKAQRPSSSRLPENQEELISFEELALPAAPPVLRRAAERFVDKLLATSLYARQRESAGRAASDDERVRAVLIALLDGGGRLHESTLSALAQVPATRLRSVLAAVRRVLSVDGYDPIGYDRDGVTVVLDIGILIEQFGVS
ncbi:BREX-2 system phosphatase PglZ [Streptosporangium sp. NBC_01810]|uniref:BREX-2 system phosphatase PglZ n=1 Tax=Streptosporangium sp. NBC_01810 TaxID=2975951 RepID=UPI002DDA2F5E|nr:BREX-2 system phosphatase PglZ [Streptosporangium sp. NBC_01810]WSA27754.1 BREX-2 system phosphatase PglZ [Streptosporangium sp. NBC_01810]